MANSKEIPAGVSSQILKVLLDQKKNKVKRGFYWETQINFAYNSEKLEGNLLTKEQTRSIFETQTLNQRDFNNQVVKADNIIETQNQFRLFDYMLSTYEKPLSKELICEYHKILKRGTSDEIDNPNFVVGGWKTIPNSIGDHVTVSPKNVDAEIEKLLAAYDKKTDKELAYIGKFHALFERIHPFQDGNGRIGRIIMFKECLNNNLCPFLVLDDTKQVYFNSLQQFQENEDLIVDYLLDMQYIYFDRFKDLLP